MIKAHCMGMEFPKRDTDGPNVNWVSVNLDTVLPEPQKNKYPIFSAHCVETWALPSAADLDAVAEEQRVKEKTSAQVPNR